MYTQRRGCRSKEGQFRSTNTAIQEGRGNRMREDPLQLRGIPSRRLGVFEKDQAENEIPQCFQVPINAVENSCKTVLSQKFFGKFVFLCGASTKIDPCLGKTDDPNRSSSSIPSSVKRVVFSLWMYLSPPFNDPFPTSQHPYPFFQAVNLKIRPQSR